MKKIIYSFVLMLGFLFSSPIFSYDQSPPCYKQLQQSFFREDLLVSGLSLYSVNQNMWSNINRDLQAAALNVPSIVESLARAKNPNPLEPVFIPGAAAEILQQALFSVFEGVMRHYAAQGLNTVINQNTINGIFRYIWEQQYNQIAACMR